MTKYNMTVDVNKAFPAASDVAANAVLTGMAQNHAMSLDSFVGDKAATIARVKEQSGQYYTYNKGDLHRNEMQLRGNAAPAAESGQDMSLASYFCDVYALKVALGKQINSNLAQYVDPEQGVVNYLTQQAFLQRDIKWAADCFVTGVWTGVADASPGTKWDTYASSTPRSDILDTISSLRTVMGRDANTIVTSDKVIRVLQQHSDFTGLTVYTKSGLPSLDDLAAAFGVERILVGKASKNTADRGLTASYSDVFTDNFLICYIDPAASQNNPTAIAGMIWDEHDQLGDAGVRMRSWYDQDRDADMYEAQIAFDYKVAGAEYGALINNVLA